jgi:hypothetical protein
MNYRKLWMKQNGPIPVDEQGRSYEIHHIDGNRKNNCLENLLCLSIEDHYKLHYAKGEYFAANLIAQRMEKPAEPIQKWDVSDKRRAAMRESKLGDKNPMKDPAVRKKVSEALKGRKKSPEAEAKRLKSREGFKHSEESKQKIQTALKGKAKTEEHKKQMSKSKLGHKRSQESINKQIEKRKGIPLSEEVKQKMRKPKSKLTCPHCQQVGGSSQMKRWHFENCKNKI